MECHHCTGIVASHDCLNPSSVTVTPRVMPSMMTSEPRAPTVVGATPNGSRWLGSLALKACSTASRLSSGTGWSAVSGPVRTPVGVNTSVAWSSGAMDRSTETLTRWSKLADFRRAAEHQPVAAGYSRCGGAAGGVVGFLRWCLNHQVADAQIAAQMRRVDDDATLQLADRELRIGPDQPGRVGQVDRVHRGFQGGLADHRVIDGVGLDLQLVVVVAHRLRDEGKRQDGDERVRPQICRFADVGRQPVFGVDAGSVVDADGTDDR